MELINATTFHLAWLAGRNEPPQDSLTLFAKGTFQLVPDAPAVLSEAPRTVTGDEYVDNDPKKGPRYESDFAYFKPRTDLMLVGTCHTPEGEPLASCPVTFGVGGTRKTATVRGQRFAMPGRLGSAPRSDPQPFTSMPLTCVAAAPLEDGTIPLPSIDDPAQGFAPLNRNAAQRTGQLGTYDRKWQEERWPYFPEDFDWGYFNAAPEDLQVDYLAGDESLYFENLHPEHGEYRSQLPGVLARCFVDAAEGEGFREVEMHLDTLWVDMDAQTLVLVWRGVADIESRDYTELSHVYLAVDELAAPKSVDEHEEDFRALIAPPVAEPEEAEPAAEPQPEREPAAEEAAPGSEPAAEEVDAQMEEALAQCREAMRQAGQDPAIIDKIVEADDPGVVLNEYFRELGIDPAQGDALLAESQAQAKQSLTDQGLDPQDIELLFGEG